MSSLEYLCASVRAAWWERTDLFLEGGLQNLRSIVGGHHSFWVFPALGMRENRVVLAFVWDLFGCIYVLSQRIGRPVESRLWNFKDEEYLTF